MLSYNSDKTIESALNLKKHITPSRLQ